MLNISSCTCWPFVVFIKTSVQVLCTFFKNWIAFLLLSYMNSLHILDINFLSGKWFANIFSHLKGCLFTFLTISITMQRLFKFYIVPFNYLCFCCLCFWYHIKKSFLRPTSSSFLLPVLLGVLQFQVLCLSHTSSWVIFCEWYKIGV